MCSSSRRTCGANQRASRRLRAFGSKPVGLRIGAGSAAGSARRLAGGEHLATDLVRGRTRSSVRRLGGTVQVFARAISTASGLRSVPIARRPFARASTSTVPRAAERIDDRLGPPGALADELDQHLRGRRMEPCRVRVKRVGQRVGGLAIGLSRGQCVDEHGGGGRVAVAKDLPGRARHGERAALGQGTAGHGANMGQAARPSKPQPAISAIFKANRRYATVFGACR